jgi:hypothetical protein
LKGGTMIAVRVRAAGVTLAAGLPLITTGCSSAMLAETCDACLPPTARGDYSIVKIRAGHAWRVTSGQDVPQSVSW